MGGEGGETGRTLEVAFGLEGWGLVLKLYWHRSHTVFALCAYLGWHGVLSAVTGSLLPASSWYLALRVCLFLTMKQKPKR